MSSPTRNDLCPCGSGKKYKRCCLGPAEPAMTEAGKLAHVRNTAERSVFEKLAMRAIREYGRDWMFAFLDSFCGGIPCDESELQFFVPWLHYLLPTDDGTPAQEFLSDPRTRLSTAERDAIDASMRSHVSMYEARAVEAGVGMELFDHLTGRTVFVHDVRASQTMEPWNTMLAAVAEHPEVNVLVAMHPSALRPIEAQAVVADARRVLRVRTHVVKVERLRERRFQAGLVASWRFEVEEFRARAAAPRSMSNSDGDPLLFCTDHFQIVTRPPERAMAALSKLPGADRWQQDGVDEVVFTRGTGKRRESEGDTVIARAERRGSKLVVETNSAARGDTLRSRIQETLGAALRHEHREIRTVEELRRLAEQSPREPEPPRDRPPEVQQLVRQALEQHYRAWVDDAIPALDGMTPRSAATNARMRPRLIALLKQLEQGERSKADADRFDVGHLWRELKLDRLR